MKQHWLVKQEPEDYAWTQFVADKGTAWTGVRNYQARIHLRAMRKGDTVFYYHSGAERAVIGIASVGRTAYPDPTTEEGDWSAVDLVPVKALPRPVSLVQIKACPALQKIALVRQSRLSVMPLQKSEFAQILQLCKS